MKHRLTTDMRLVAPHSPKLAKPTSHIGDVVRNNFKNLKPAMTVEDLQKNIIKEFGSDVTQKNYLKKADRGLWNSKKS